MLDRDSRTVPADRENVIRVGSTPAGMVYVNHALLGLLWYCRVSAEDDVVTRHRSRSTEVGRVLTEAPDVAVSPDWATTSVQPSVSEVTLTEMLASGRVP